jgi:hypothetical protein
VKTRDFKAWITSLLFLTFTVLQGVYAMFFRGRDRDTLERIECRLLRIEAALKVIRANQLTEINAQLKPLIASLNKSNTSLEDAVEAAGDNPNPTAGASE